MSVAIETLDDIIEELADQLGIYGGCSVHAEQRECLINMTCRGCWVSSLQSRIREAVLVQNWQEGKR